jgi:hypothetical protein
MKNARVLLMAFMALLAAASAEVITTKGGMSYIDAKVARVTADGLMITHLGGTDFVDFDRLPDPVAQQYGWTKEKSAAREEARKAREEQELNQINTSIELLDRTGKYMARLRGLEGIPAGEERDKIMRELNPIGTQLDADWKEHQRRQKEREAIEKSLLKTDYTPLVLPGGIALALLAILFSPASRRLQKASKRRLYMLASALILVALGVFFHENKHLGVNELVFILPAILLREFLPSSGESLGRLAGTAGRKISDSDPGSSSDSGKN